DGALHDELSERHDVGLPPPQWRDGRTGLEPAEWHHGGRDGVAGVRTRRTRGLLRHRRAAERAGRAGHRELSGLRHDREAMIAITPPRWSAKASEAGSSLVELLIALVVIALGVLAVAQLFPAGSRGQNRERMLSAANHYAQ